MHVRTQSCSNSSFYCGREWLTRLESYTEKELVVEDCSFQGTLETAVSMC